VISESRALDEAVFEVPAMIFATDKKPVNPLLRKGFGIAVRVVPSLGVLGMVYACTSANFDFGALRGGPRFPATQTLPLAAGETFGKGPVRVALLLPLSDPNLANVGQSMANGAKLAVQFIEANPNIADNITVVLKDTGTTPQIAAQRASEAVSEGASIILGPLRADDVTAAGAVAKAAGIPLIGFSNNTGAAAPGVYLLNVLPEVEARRSLGYVKTKGRKAFAGIFPTTAYGRIQEGAFRQASADLGLNARAVYNFSNETEARAAIQQLIPFLKDGSIDALFIPDRATAPSFGVLLEEAGVSQANLTVIGSADWDGDMKIGQTSYLAGAVYPTVDDAGFLALKAEYQGKFGTAPHPLATIAYTATILANASSLALGNPRYDRTQMTSPGGFNGRDGVFRFLPDGRSEYALVMKQVVTGGSIRIDGPKL
jgi:branched-chain amino acid transport system substrate-binding protein